MITCFGEALMRLTSAPGDRLLDSGALQIHVGGAELNVASGLSAYGLATRFATHLPSNDLGGEVLAQIRGRGISTDTIKFKDGRLGLYFQTPGSDLRGGNIVYDREGSSLAQITPDDMDIEAALEGSNWLHISGVTLALGPQVADTAIALAEAAAAKDMDVSFDFNHRAKLWQRWGGDPAPYLQRMMACATVVMGNDFDLMKVLDEPEARATRSLHLADTALAAFPRLKAVASAYRTVERAERHKLQGEIVTRKRRVQTPEVILDSVIDRVGGGDAFAAGLIAGFIKELDTETILARAFSSMILKHGWRGDATKSDWAEVESFDPSGSSDVKR